MSICLNTLETLKSKVMIGHFVVRYFRKKIGNFIFIPSFYGKGSLKGVCFDFQLSSGYTSVMGRCSYVRYDIPKEDII